MKKAFVYIISILLLFVVSVPAFAAESAVVSCAAPQQAALGQTVTVTVSLSNCDPFHSMGLAFSYDSNVFELVSGQWTNMSGSMLRHFNKETNDAAVAFSSAVTKSGVIFELTLKVKNSCAAVGTAAITVDPVIKNGSAEISASASSVSVKIPGPDHTFSSWTEAVAATCTEKGTQERTCSVCQTRQTREIAALGHSIENGICATCGLLESYYWVLTADADVQLSLTEDLYVDLNGHDLTGIIVTNGYQIHGMDSSTNYYSCENIGYFTCTDEMGNAIVPALHVTTTEEMVGGICRYLTIETAAGYSFHRFYLGITHTTLYPAVDGMGYKALFCADDMVVSRLDTFGYTLQLGENPALTVTKGAEKFVSGKTVTLRLSNFNAENYGETALRAQVSMQLTDGTPLQSSVKTYTLRNLMEMANANHASYNQTQLTALKAMITANPIMKQWQTENLQ